MGLFIGRQYDFCWRQFSGEVWSSLILFLGLQPRVGGKITYNLTGLSPKRDGGWFYKGQARSLKTTRKGEPLSKNAFLLCIRPG